jgi:hypothetical protein
MRKLVSVVVALFFVLAVNAQYTSGLSVEEQYPGDQKAQKVFQTAVEKQVNPKTSALRTSWIANTPGSNWFFSLEGGVAHLLSEGYSVRDLKDNIAPTVGLSVGKWFSPVWGARLNVTGAKLEGLGYPDGIWYTGSHIDGYQSYTVGNTPAARGMIKDLFLKETYKDNENLYLHDFTYVAASVDFLLNLKNFFTPYNPKAFFNPVAYAGVGYAHTLKDGDRTAVNNLLFKGGLQFNFRLGDRWDLYLAGESLVVPENFDRYVGDDKTTEAVINAKLGLTYRFNFRHFVKTPLVDPSVIDALNKELNELRNRPQVVCPPEKICPEPKLAVQPTVEKAIELTPVFFTIDSYAVRDAQLVSVARAAQYLLDNPSAQLEISGYADKNTGNPGYNLKLSEKRANAVVKVLTQKFGIEKSRLTIKPWGDTKQPYSENDKNRVVLFVK